MVMTDSEVKVNVLQAKDQRAQVKICAELNAVCEEQIKDILKAQGVDLRMLKGDSRWKLGEGKNKPEKKYKIINEGGIGRLVNTNEQSKPEEQKKETQGTPIASLRKRIESLLKQREGIEAELNDIRKQLTELLDMT